MTRRLTILLLIMALRSVADTPAAAPALMASLGQCGGHVRAGLVILPKGESAKTDNIAFEFPDSPSMKAEVTDARPAEQSKLVSVKFRLHGQVARSLPQGFSLWREKFSKKLFEERCLEEYASAFPTVCGDFAFYQFPPVAFWAKLLTQTPPGFRWGLKVPEQITVPVWPIHPRNGALAGKRNPDFLDARLLEHSFLKPLEPYRERIGVLIFEFASNAPGAFDARGAICGR